MNRRTFLCGLTLGGLSMPLAAEAQPGRIFRVGFLTAFSSSEPDPRFDTFREELRNLGYVEGQNLRIERRYAEGSDARFRALAAELVDLQVDVIVAGGSAATKAAQQATRTIPIVMASSGDPVGMGFVTSLARPGGTPRA